MESMKEIGVSEERNVNEILTSHGSRKIHYTDSLVITCLGLLHS